MSGGLSADINVKIARALASGDKEAAASLAGEIAAATASGDAHGFELDLARLQKLAGTAALGKRAVPSSGLAGPLQARADTTITMMQRADTPRELEVAKAAGEALVKDLQAHRLFKALFAPQRAKQMGLS